MTSNNHEQSPRRGSAQHVPVAELARRLGVGPVESVDEMARLELFESDEELEEFLADLYISRRAGLA